MQHYASGSRDFMSNIALIWHDYATIFNPQFYIAQLCSFYFEFTIIATDSLPPFIFFSFVRHIMLILIIFISLRMVALHQIVNK